MQINLPNIYYYTDHFNLADLLKLNNKISIIYRNYKEETNKETIYSLKKFCRNTKRKLFIANNIKQAIGMKLDGVYIPSFNIKINYASSYRYPTNFKIIGSAHNISEIRVKEIQKVKKILISSLFKKNKNYLGINRFQLLSSLTNKQTVALGGISKKNLKKLRLLSFCDFAGISYFKE